MEAKREGKSTCRLQRQKREREREREENGSDALAPGSLCLLAAPITPCGPYLQVACGGGQSSTDSQ